jgi:hypothetical protein
MQLPKTNRQSKKGILLGLSSLLREKSGDILIFAFFLAVSCGFWFLQKLEDTFESEVVFPIEIVEMPKGMVITSPLPKEIIVNVQDRGTNLFNFVRHSCEVEPIKIDFSLYDDGAQTNKVAIPTVDLQRVIQQQLPSSTQIMEMSPNKIEFHYNRGISKRLPVSFLGKVTTGMQHYLQDITFSPDSVTVYATSSILDTLQYAYIQSQEINGLTRTSKFEVGFTSISTMKMVPETVVMTAHIDYYTEQTMQIPIVGVDFPKGCVLKTFPAMANVKFWVKAAMLKRLKPENFVLGSTYEELLANTDQKLRLQLTSIPDGVSNVRIYPQEVDFLLEQTYESFTDSLASVDKFAKY